MKYVFLICSWFQHDSETLLFVYTKMAELRCACVEKLQKWHPPSLAVGIDAFVRFQISYAPNLCLMFNFQGHFHVCIGSMLMFRWDTCSEGNRLGIWEQVSVGCCEIDTSRQSLRRVRMPRVREQGHSIAQRWADTALEFVVNQCRGKIIANIRNSQSCILHRILYWLTKEWLKCFLDISTFILRDGKLMGS